MLVQVIFAGRASSGTEPTSLLEQIGGLVNYKNAPLEGEADDRINVLLLGIGGDGHAGGKLTDTIMVASIKPSTKQVSLLSLPRDLIVKIDSAEQPGYWEGRKINYAYALGGSELAQKKVSEVTGLSLPYYIVLDFAGFKKMIDDIDGIDVTVDRTFIGLYGSKDLAEPCAAKEIHWLDDGPYCAITFNRGQHHMDGEQALIFARVRKLAPQSPNSDEGSDFARAQRQQKILEAFKQKLFSAGTIIRPSRFASVLNDFDQHLETNLQLWEIGRLLELVATISSDDIIHQVVDNSPDGLVKTDWYEPTGASVVVPTAGDYNYSEIQKMARRIFKIKTGTNANENTNEITDAETAVADDTMAIYANVQVLNGTSISGLAASTAANLTNLGYTISGVGNAPTKDYSVTRIYDLTADSANPTTQPNATLQNLVAEVNGEVATIEDRDTLLSLDPTGVYFDTNADYIIILGANYVAAKSD